MGRPRKIPRKGLLVQWAEREGWKSFGDRLDFLSNEQEHLQTGRLRILPAKERDAKAKA